MEEPKGSPKNWPPLGLPAGSVRALLTLTILAVVVTTYVRDRELDVLWVETLLIALAHYFTTRRFVALPPEAMRRLQEEGVIEDERHPLYLPRGSIRTIILATFAGLAYYLSREGRLHEPRVVTLLGIVSAYVLGAIVRGVTGWFQRRRTSRPSRFWADARAMIALGALALAAIPVFFDEAQLFSPELHKIALAIALFYFGSR
jgi:hypothetical protein